MMFVLAITLLFWTDYSKLARLPELGNDAPIGGSTDDYATLIATHLADPVKQKKYHKYLDKLGYKPKKSKA